MSQPNSFKGNKQSLPSKPCAVCQRTMTWRKAWAKNWDHVLYCSDRCRADKPKSTNASPAQATPIPGKKASA